MGAAQTEAAERPWYVSTAGIFASLPPTTPALARMVSSTNSVLQAPVALVEIAFQAAYQKIGDYLLHKATADCRPPDGTSARWWLCVVSKEGTCGSSLGNPLPFSFRDESFSLSP